jgi:hypothetical protein
MDGKQLNNEEKLNEIYRLTLENHDMIKSLRRQQYFSTAARVLYWLVVLGAIGGAYYYVRPVIGLITANSGKIEESLNQLEVLKNNLPETKMLNQLFQGLQKSVVDPSVGKTEELEGFEVVPVSTSTR